MVWGCEGGEASSRRLQDKRSPGLFTLSTSAQRDLRSCASAFLPPVALGFFWYLARMRLRSAA